MQKAIDAYFDSTDTITVCGLALALGFSQRKSFLDYEGYGVQFCNTIKAAKLRVEAAYEERLAGGNAAGPIFALKNFGWTDKQEIEHAGNVTVQLPGVQIIMPEMPNSSGVSPRQSTSGSGGVQ